MNPINAFKITICNTNHTNNTKTYLNTSSTFEKHKIEESNEQLKDKKQNTFRKQPRRNK